MPEFFVARDRARRIGWNLEKVLQERRLAWRGADIGMTSVKEDADRVLAAIAEDARTSVAAVLAGDIRDRERGFMEIPFVTTLEGVARRVERAAEAEAARRMGQRTESPSRELIEQDLAAALERLRAFQASYDQKTPLPPASQTDLAHVLARVTPPGERPYDTPPPPAVTDAYGLEDLLLAVRAALPDETGPWQVVPAAPGRPLALIWGRTTEGTEPGTPPEDVTRAADVLGFLHPVRVEAHQSEGSDGSVRLAGLVVALGDPAGEQLATAVAVATGSEARLSPAGETAVHALMAASPAFEGRPLPPDRLVALVGVLQTLDRELKTLLGPRIATGRVRLAVSDLPREATRKAPLKRALLADLERQLPGLPPQRLSDLVDDLARGRWKASRLVAGDAALLLSVLGRDSRLGGQRLEAALDLAPWTDEDVDAIVADLVDVAVIRKTLEGAGSLAPSELTRLECAAIAALGRLGVWQTAP